MTRQTCPVCAELSFFYKTVQGFAFFECSQCSVIHIDVDCLDKIDAGAPIILYQNDYWKQEYSAARQRLPMSVTRLVEAIYLSQIPVQRVIDIGTGQGLILEEMERFLPVNSRAIFGIEKFPPDIRTRSPGYRIGSLQDIASEGLYDAGLCMEVIEHLTPLMVRHLLTELSQLASEGGCFLFNTGLAESVKTRNPDYINPGVLGHIMFWTVEAMNVLGAPLGFTAQRFMDRDWCFILEKTTIALKPITERVYTPLKENLFFLSDQNGPHSVLQQLAFNATQNSHHERLFNNAQRSLQERS